MQSFEELGPLVRQARRRRGLTQHALARAVESTQSQISRIESGQGHSASKGTLLRIIEQLELDASSYGYLLDSNVARVAYCSNAVCPRNRPEPLGDEVVWFPSIIPNQPANEKYCRICGEILAFACGECGKPIQSGSHCGFCGAPYIRAGKSALRELDPELRARIERVQARRALAEHGFQPQPSPPQLNSAPRRDE